jgi:hypothetical protein
MHMYEEFSIWPISYLRVIFRVTNEVCTLISVPLLKHAVKQARIWLTNACRLRCQLNVAFKDNFINQKLVQLAYVIILARVTCLFELGHYSQQVALYVA